MFSNREDTISNFSFKPVDVKLKRGDVLLCKKTAEADACEDSDFQWLDTDSDTFASTRPTNTVQMDFVTNQTVGQQADGTWGDVFCNTSGACSFENGPNTGPYCGMSSAKFAFSFTLPSDERIKLNTEIKAYKPKEDEPTGTIDEDYLNGAYTVFTLTDAAGTSTTGTKAKIDIQLDLTNLIFAPDESDDEAFFQKSEAEIFKKLIIKDMWRRGNKQNFGHTSNNEATVDVEILDADTFESKVGQSEAAD